MASPIELKIVRYGSSDVSGLIDEEITLVHNYNPKPGNGVDDISESIPLFLEGTQATVRASITTINNMLARANERNENGFGDNIYMMTRTGGTAESWRRTRIMEGRLSATDGGIIAGLTSNNRTPVTLSITRAGYFEDDPQTYVPFYNSNGTLSGVNTINVFNCNSGAGAAPNKLENYALVHADGISGDLPAPINLRMTNATAGTAIDKYFVSLNTAGYGTANPSYFYYDISGTADATCSGGSAGTATLSTATETDMFTVNITGPTPFEQLGSKPYHVIARFGNNTSLANVKFRLKFKSGTTTIWSGPQFLLPNTDIIQDLGVVNLPPGVASQWSDGNLVITGQRTTGSSETIRLDYIQLFGGTYSELNGIVPVVYGEYVVFWGINKSISRHSTLSYMDWVIYGSGALVLTPKKTNMLLIVAQTSTPETAKIDRKTTISATYRPRWSSPL